jgi:epoxyqueuosine reductase
MDQVRATGGRRSPVKDAGSIKSAALDLGFDAVGIAPAGPAPHGRQLRDWIERGYAAEMAYMARSARERADVRIRFPWAKSVACVAVRYPGPGAGAREGAAIGHGRGTVERRARVSCYALGDDYHEVLGRRLSRLEAVLRGAGAEEVRTYVDTGPVLERDWAARAGLGWIGRNTTLINRSMGSWLFLGVAITDLAIQPDAPVEERCGDCTACIDACPTGAILGPYTLDSRRCISYLTIEFKGVLPAGLRGGLGTWVFGCDVCQEVCPWNAKAARSADLPDPDPALRPRPGLAELDIGWALSNPDALSTMIQGTAVERARGERLTRNLIIAAANSGDRRLARALEPYVVTASSALAEQLGWALKRLRA